MRAIAKAIFVAGTLDIASAILLTLARGKSPEAMLQGIAAGPFGDDMRGAGISGALAGLAVHYAIMAVMVAAFAAAASRRPVLLNRPLASGAAYGVLLYLVMYWLVIPLRWGAEAATLGWNRVVVPIAIHILLVGWPIALILARERAAPAPASGAAGRSSSRRA